MCAVQVTDEDLQHYVQSNKLTNPAIIAASNAQAKKQGRAAPDQIKPGTHIPHGPMSELELAEQAVKVRCCTVSYASFCLPLSEVSLCCSGQCRLLEISLNTEAGIIAPGTRLCGCFGGFCAQGGQNQL